MSAGDNWFSRPKFPDNARRRELQGRIGDDQKQVQRFRVYAFDAEDNIVGEETIGVERSPGEYRATTASTTRSTMAILRRVCPRRNAISTSFPIRTAKKTRSLMAELSPVSTRTRRHRPGLLGHFGAVSLMQSQAGLGQLRPTTAGDCLSAAAGCRTCSDGIPA